MIRMLLLLAAAVVVVEAVGIFLTARSEAGATRITEMQQQTAVARQLLISITNTTAIIIIIIVITSILAIDLAPMRAAVATAVMLPVNL